MATTLWAMPEAGPSRFGPQASETLIAMQSPSPSSSPAFRSNLPVPTASGGPGPSSLGHGISAPSTSESASTYSASVHSASVRSVSVHSTSIHSASVNSGRNLSSIFTRRGSHHNSGRRSKSVRSGESNRSDGTADDAFEMVSLPTRAHGKKRMVQEHHEARIDRRKAEAAVAKWRKWIVEQPPQAQHPLDANPIHSTSSFLFRAEHHPLRSPEGIPATTPPSSLSRSDPSPSQTRDATHHANTSSWGSLSGPSASGSSWNAEVGPNSSEGSHKVPAAPSTVGSNFMRSLVPGALDIYTTESVRALRDVELAVDPDWLAASSVSPLSRVRRLSTHPRVSPDMENPFSTIDTLLCRRRIRPLVLELVQALGAYIDAVWYTTYPDQPCPWAGVPLSIAARRTSVGPNAGAPPSKTWRSWTITAVQEGKRQGFMSCPPTEADVAFWGREIRYGLRDIDEAINRRKDLGWAFGETVIKGHYGDIVPSNVLTPGGKAANIPRLLNDLEEALWGDALPAPSDLAFEHDEDFDPFSVYREGDELIGIESQQPLEAREAELRKIFGEYYPTQGSRVSYGGEPSSPTVPLSSPDRDPPGLSSSPKSRYEASPRTPADHVVTVMPNLDFASLGALQELSTEDKLELGRRRHQEYVERKKAGEEG